jgi:uncharacterized protein with FMN-binding domain
MIEKGIERIKGDPIMNKKRVILITVLILVIVTILTVAGVKVYLQSNLERLVALPITNIDFTKLADGTYSGSYKAFPVDAEVKVLISNHKIINIELVKHGNGQGAPAEVIPGKVVEAQTLDVDIVSGAIYSSKVILKAIENALNVSLKK